MADRGRQRQDEAGAAASQFRGVGGVILARSGESTGTRGRLTGAHRILPLPAAIGYSGGSPAPAEPIRISVRGSSPAAHQSLRIDNITTC